MISVAETLGVARSLMIYRGRPWKTRALAAFYSQFVGPGDLAFDIGAHVGSRTLALRRAGARVVAFEPQPIFHALLERALPRDGITLRREALGATAGEMRMHVSSRHPTVSTVSRDWMERVRTANGFEMVAWDKTEAITVTTLDAVIEGYGVPRFCKIDVEGAEADILHGLSRPIPCIAFEYLPAALDLAACCIEVVTSLGAYHFNRVEGEDHELLHPQWLTGNEMLSEVREAARNGRSGDIYARLD